jgi:hypothetical protein
LTGSRLLVVAVLAAVAVAAWNDPLAFNGPRSSGAAVVWLLVTASLIGLSWFVLGWLMQSAARSISFDEDGLWHTAIGKAQGLVRWRDICGVQEHSSALALMDRNEQLLLKVEYERENYARIRHLIMERMSFSPPTLPLLVSASRIGKSSRIAFACVALLSLGMGVRAAAVSSRPALVALSLFIAVIFALLAIPRPRITLDEQGIRIGRRAYPFSSIRSVEGSLITIRSRYIPKLTLDVGAPRPAIIVTRGLPIDTLTLERTILWALSKARQGLRRPVVRGTIPPPKARGAQ